MLHVVDMTDPSSPQLLTTKAFDTVNQGFPDIVKGLWLILLTVLCRPSCDPAAWYFK